MRIHQYIHLGPDDHVDVRHCDDGQVRLAVTTEVEPVYYLFLSQGQADDLRSNLDTPPPPPAE